MTKLEKLNIVGKRSGEGFIAHKATLVNALQRAIADRVMVSNITLGRKGLLSWHLQALAPLLLANSWPLGPANLFCQASLLPS